VNLRLVVVYFFRALALGIGIPSLISTVYFGWASVQLHRNPGPLPPAAQSSNALVRLIETGGRLIGGMFRLFGNLGEWLVIVVATISLVVFLFAVLLWLTASGLAQGRLWARILAVFCGLALLAVIALVGAARSNMQ